MVKFVRKEAMPMRQTLLIRSIRPAGGQITNVLIRDGYIVSIGGARADDEAEQIDGFG